jgi:sugar lactone lactonase YvrE
MEAPTDDGSGVTSDPIACTTEQNLLGEGVRWDARRDELLRVDLLAGRVFRDRIADDGGLIPVRTYDLSGTVSAIAPIEGDDGWLLAANRGIAHLSLDGSLRPLADIAPQGTRMNDAACDPQGRFWAGTTSDRPGAAALYRLGPDGRTELMIDGLTTSNGLGWSPDGRTMYLADSGPALVHAFDFDGDRGTISNGRVLIDRADEPGTPDGLTIDADGNLWVAIWGAGRINQCTADGVLRQELIVPAAQTTCCAFAGPGLHRLYVTTATEDFSDEQRRADPAAGLLYRVETLATGLPAARYRPDRSWWATVIA